MKIILPRKEVSTEPGAIQVAWYGKAWRLLS
jgi:hypothetical protein